MDIATLLASNSSAPEQLGNENSAFRKADFLKIMLAEIANQDPFKPQETGELVENMRKLQELANSEFEKFRQDMRFAQDIVGEDVMVGQVNIPESEAQLLRERGVNPDVGYGVVEGTVENFRMVEEQVWLTIDGKDYPVDNIQQLRSQGNGRQLAELAEGLLGREVDYRLPEGSGSGVVSDVRLDSDDQVLVVADGVAVPFDALRRIGTGGAGD